jgi:hypothetical protein
MNHILLLSNVIALALLLGFTFTPQKDEVSIVQRMPHYLQLQKAPQLAVMNTDSGFAVHSGSQGTAVLPAHSSDRLVF